MDTIFVVLQQHFPLKLYPMSTISLRAVTTTSALPMNKETSWREMPHNQEAEQALLGALLVNNNSLEKVAEFLHADHFFVPVHGRIYQAIHTFFERGQNATPVTLKGYFEKDDDLAQIGGAAYLAELASYVVSVVNVEDYGRAIFEHHLRRQLIALGEEMVGEAYAHSLDVTAQKQIEQAEGRLYELAQFGDFKGGFTKLEQSVLAAIQTAKMARESDSHVTGVTTGLIDLDTKLGGLHKSDLIILAGRPSMGKTALATNIAFNAARRHHETEGKEGAVVGFFSLEMSAEQLATRLLAEVVQISGDKIRKGQIKAEDFRKFAEASNLLSSLPLYIDDTPALTIAHIRARARRLKRQHGLGMIVVDYLQLIGGSTQRSQENRVQEISEISRGLKTLAKELQVPVLALSQLSRQVEQRENKRPQLSDLRESGSIEQDADVVMFVYREEYYLSREKPGQTATEKDDRYQERLRRWEERQEYVRNVAECIIGKQRHGPIGTVPLSFMGEFTKFGNLDRDYKVIED
jgi:replicative DNA helicase